MGCCAAFFFGRRIPVQGPGDSVNDTRYSNATQTCGQIVVTPPFGESSDVGPCSFE